jgi:pantoate--beta-alanine ligase
VERIDSVAGIKARLANAREAGLRIGLVPTMGALHDGHLSLVRQVAARAELVVASIFVNPTQFAPGEDLDKYPRDLEGDATKLEAAGCTLLFCPSVDEIYPPGFETTVELSRSSRGLCGDVRPGHFAGVATVVLKLLCITQPHVAIFGEKDFQQLTVIRRLVADLCLDVEVLGAPLVRDADGLALSSRNAYLSAGDRSRALAISAGLREAAEAWEAGERDGLTLLALVQRRMAEQQVVPEYLELRRFEDLAPLDRADGACVILTAARVGSTRLIDNRILRRPE